jgi:hypothetical protein
VNPALLERLSKINTTENVVSFIFITNGKNPVRPDCARLARRIAQLLHKSLMQLPEKG